MKPILTIAGSDCSGGAGIQADLKVFSSHGLYGMSVITSVVAENTCKVIDKQDILPSIVEKQIRAVLEDISTDTIKIGMLPSKECMESVVNSISSFNISNIVIDPIMLATDNNELMAKNALTYFKENIVPLATLLTPNIPEAEKLSGITITSLEERKKAAKIIMKLLCKNVLIKGGHSNGDALDLLYDGNEFYTYSSERILTKNTHGTGCTYSSAIASNLALSYSMQDSIKRAKEYVTNAIANSLNIGHGHGPTNHFYGITNTNYKEDII